MNEKDSPDGCPLGVGVSAVQTLLVVEVLSFDEVLQYLLSGDLVHREWRMEWDRRKPVGGLGDGQQHDQEIKRAEVEPGDCRHWHA